MVDEKMFTELPYGLPGRLFRSRMPFSHFDPEGTLMKKFEENDISVAVLLVENGEWFDRTGKDLPAIYAQAGIKVIHLPALDYNVPSRNELESAMLQVIEHAESGKNVVMHCYAGIGRTGVFAACLAKKVLGLSGADAIDWVRSHVPGALETSGQRAFVTAGDK